MERVCISVKHQKEAVPGTIFRHCLFILCSGPDRRRSARLQEPVPYLGGLADVDRRRGAATAHRVRAGREVFPDVGPEVLRAAVPGPGLGDRIVHLPAG